MAPLSLKIILDEGAVTRTLMFDTTTKVWDAHCIVKEKILTLDPDKEYGFFLTSADDDNSGVWLSNDKTLEYYMLRDGDSVQFLTKMRNIRLRMLDGSVKTLQVDESKIIEQLLVHICSKIGITNYEEYGLCREEDSQSVEEAKSNTGTLTLKKKSKIKDKDVQLEQLSKKLKTDDNVEWLDQHRTLRECGVDTNETLLFKRRLFYSDRNIDSRDPVQLNLLYVQTRDAILNGKQVVTEDKAAEFAGIQCQIQYGDFQEEKHKPGFIENLKEFLPEQYASSWSVEKKIIKEHRKHNGLSQIEAKHLYTKTARELPTYGVTFFLVKEKQKGKKKLVPRLLGINSESILRLDEETKEILQVWLLTQVKSYRAGSESFTLNFGDYSEKEYAVKTNDAYRIRDILQGYIDIIRKRLAAPYNVSFTEGESMLEDMVESSRGTITQTVVPRKVQEESLVGPSQIISVDQSYQSQQGTRIVTVHEIITTTRTDKTQQAMRGEFGSSNAPQDFGKKLNRLNSEAVKAVVLLSDPTNENLQTVRKIVAGFEDDLPGIIKGANEAAIGLKEEDSKKLLDDLDELCAFMNTLAATTKRSDLHDPDNLMTAQDAARKIAELSTQMCFSLDPKIKRCSKILSRSRKSFILDEKTEASLRRASFLNATDSACRAVEEAQNDLDEEYHGPRLTEDQIRDLERKTTARMGKLNAAIALLMNAHADPRNIDYEMAVNSMKTINEIMPGLIKDAKPLIANGDETTKRKIRDQIIQLLDGTRAICMLTGSDDISKMHDIGNDYAEVSKKLIFTFNRPNRANPEVSAMHDMENEIVQLAKDVGEKVSSLLTLTSEVANYDPEDPQAMDLCTASAKCADATQGLLACTKLTAPLIQEPHCQSALTAAAENLSSSVQNLALACKPLVEKPGRLGLAKSLADKSFDLAKALDKLKRSYAHLNTDMQTVEEDDSDMQDQKRLKFIIRPKMTKDSLTDAHNQLQELINTSTIMAQDPINNKKSKNLDAQRLLSQKMAELNGAIASLLQSTTDPENPDTDRAIAAIEAITTLTPNIINDAKDLQGTVNENEWNNIMKYLKDILDTTQDICAEAENGNIEGLNDAASKMGKSSGRLTFVFNPRSNSKMKDEILDLSKLAVKTALELQPKLENLAKCIDREEGHLLKSTGAKIEDAAEDLLKTAEVIAPSIEDSRCQAALLSAIDRLSERTQQLHNSLELPSQTSQHGQSGEDIKHDLKHIQSTLDKLQQAVQNKSGNGKDSHHDDKQRLHFITALSRAKNAVIDAENALKQANNKPFVKAKQIDKLNVLEPRNLLSERLARLNGAIANLMQATSDERPNFEVAAAALNTISSVTPDIIKDANALQGSVGDKSWNEIMESLKSILDATKDMCSNDEDPQVTSEAAMKLANSVGRLTYVVNPRKNVDKENQILDLSKSAVEQTSAMLSNVYQLIEEVGGDDGEKLDKAGVKVLGTAQMLLKTAEITAPSMEDHLCQKALLSAIDRLSGRARNLQSAWKPLAASQKYHRTGENLDQNLKEVETTLDKLREACKDVGGKDSESQQRTQELDKKRLHFNATLSRTKDAMIDADKELKDLTNKPFDKSKPLPKHDVPATRNLLSERLAKLNAAIANLLQATSDNERPDLEAAAAAINTISTVTPDVIKDVKKLQGSVEDKSWAEIIENLKSILDATNDMCSNEEDPQATSEASLKLANSVGRLTYVVNPRKNANKENQILDLSKCAVEQTSAMLSNVYQLIEEVGGDDGEKLDKAGVKVVDTAQMLLKTAEITAPSMEDDLCQKVLLSAIDCLSDRASDLQSAWKPLAVSPKYHQTGEDLDQNLKEVDSTLDKLRKACKDVGGKENESHQQTQEQKKQRLHYNDTFSRAKNTVIDADKELKELMNKPRNKTKQFEDHNVPSTRKLLSERLARLNATIANLLLATSDNERPNLEVVAVAVETISNETPGFINNVKTLQGSVDDKAWAEIMEGLKSILEATKAMCSSSDDPQAITDSSMNLAKSVGRLTYVINPRKNVEKENQILDLSKSAVEKTSGMLSNVYQMIEDVGGAEGYKLDEVGVKVVDSAQKLLKTAEITAPSMENSLCQETLLSAIDRLSGQARDLQSAWKPLAATPKYHQTGQHLDKDLREVQSTLDKLREACQAVDGSLKDDETEKEIEEQKKQRLHFVSTLSKAKNAMIQANKELQDVAYTAPKVKSVDDKNNAPAIRNVLSQRLAELNAAIANLLQATSDRDKPHYEDAAASINTISYLAPAIIKDAKGLQGCVDDKSWKVIMDNLKSLIDSTSDLCVNSENPKELSDTATKFANSAGRLTYVLNPRKSTKKENQIINLAKSAVEDTSILLSNVYQLTETIGGKDGEKLDTAGVKVVDSAKILLKTAEVTASSVEEPRCQQALLRAIDHLSDRADDLQTTWDSLTESPEHQNARGELSNKLKQVQATLQNLRQACQEKDLESDDQEKQHLELIATLSDAKRAVKDAQDDLKKVNNAPPSSVMDKSNVPAAKMLLSKKLAQLNAGMAELLQATSDTVKPDYKAAAKAINTISNLTPQIVKDTQNLHGAVKDKSWKNLIDNLKALLDSTNDVCNNVEDPQALKNSASKFANAAGRLTYVFNPHSNVKKENQIQDLSRCALEQTSLLLSNVYNLTEKGGGEDAERLDQAGVRVVDSAQTLLRTAEITSPSISDVHCQNALLASIDKLADHTKVLKNTWMPLVQTPQYHSTGDQLDQNVKIVHATLDKLRKACQDTDDSKDAKPDRLLKNISKAKENIRAQEKLFSEDNMAQRAAEARSQGAGKDKPVMARRIDLSQKLAKLNEAVARLLQAMLDRESPDYKSAEITVDVISKLTPEIIQETMALQSNLDDNSGRIIFEEAKNICDASQAICTSVENNSLEELNKAAIKYAQSSGKLRYVVSPRSYPNKQKTILDISRSVCERTSLMLSRVSRLAENVGGNEGENMGISGAKLGDAAHALFTNVQVLSSSIEDQNCQSALSSSADRLSKCAQDLESFWKPVIQHPQHLQIGEQLTRDSNLLNSEVDKLKEICHDNSDINNELDVAQQQQVSAKPLTKPKPPPRMEDLDNLLENIQKTVAADSKKNKVEERLLIEDTPLRQLASKIMESAKAKAESNNYSPKEREKYSRFANELANAINRLDITNAKCRDTPFDAKDKNEKALQLENAILNLQVMCIQSRQQEGQQSKIVDLMEFVEDVTSAADALANTVKDVKHNEKDALLEIKNKCQKIQDAATKLTQPQDLGTDGNMFEDTLLIDQFNKNCDADIKEITALITNIADEPLKKSLLHKLQTLSDSCDLLSFATKSSISNTESTTLEESLQNLELVEQKLEDILKPVEGLQQPVQDAADSVHAVHAAQAALAAAAAGGAGDLPRALTCYAVQMRGLTSHKDGHHKLKEHLKKLTDILKMQIAEKNRRVVTWQEDKDGELSTITENILEELQRFIHDKEASEKGGVKSSDPLKTTQLIKNSDIRRLLSPNKSPELGDEKHLKEKFNQQIQKLNSTTGTIALSVHKPESLARSLHTASEAAMQLASIAHGLKNQDAVQSKRIEKTAQEMSVATYNLLKTAESVCHSSHLPESRRRLLDACRLLNDSLNNLARATTPANMQRDCNEMSRNLQLQQSFLTFEHPSCSLNYAQCLDALQSQQEVLEKLRSEKTMSRTECSSELRFVTSAICNSTESATQSAYLLTLSNKDKDNVSKQGMVDVSRIKDLADSVNKTCLQIICNDGEKEISDQQSTLKKQVDQLQEAVDEACTKIKEDQKEELSANAHQLKAALKELNNEIKTHVFEHEENRILPKTIKLMDAINKLNYTVGRISQPNVDKDPKKAAMAKEVIDNNRNLLSNTLMMLKKASLSQEDTITWTKIGSIDVIKAFESLLTCIREKGAKAGYIEAINLDSEVPTKSFIQTQVDLACQWLRRPVAKESDKKAGVEGAENVVRMAEQMYDDLKGSEKEEMKHVIVETKQLLNDCTVKYNSEKASLLRERLKELLKMLERGVVTRVIEDFLEEEPLPNLEALHKEKDEKKRKFLLEKKIAELLAQLGRVTKTARFVADTGVAPRQELLKTSDQVELLAPALVKAAEQRVHRPDDQAAIEHYQKLLAQYADSLSRVRELCDRAVDPIDFSQAAGETMHRIKEETMNEPHKSVHTSKIIMTLCNRVIDVGMNSQNVKKDPELKKTLIDIKRAVDAKCEVKKADWRDVTAEFMRRTGEVESVLGGENIFLKQPEPDQPIYAAALHLHAAVRDWSARDNDMVAVAKRMAVLMARLSDYMNTGRKQELIYTSNSIVNESKEVAALAKKMALECSDIRIRNNLLQVCDQIPTISGQLKMLTTVKSSSLGHQDSTEDKEAMNMLVGNAQNLMISVQEVVKAAASASVKIMSQRGYRMKWRRRNYY